MRRSGLLSLIVLAPQLAPRLAERLGTGPQETPAAAEAPAEPAVEERDPQALRAAVESELEAARREQETVPAGSPDPARTVELLQRLSTQLGEEASLRERLAEQGEQRVEAPAAEQEVVGFLDLERLRDQLGAERARQPGLEAAVEAARAALAPARDELERQRRERRQAEQDPARAGALRLVRLQERLAEQIVRNLELELELVQGELALHGERVDSLAGRVDRLAGEVAFERRDLATVRAELAAARERIAKDRDILEFDLPVLRERAAQAERRLEEENPDDPVLQLAAETLQLERRARRSEIDVKSHQIQRLERSEVAWDRRHAVANRAVEGDELLRWRDEVEVWQHDLEREAQLEEVQLAGWRGELAQVDARLARAPPEADQESFWLRAKRRHLLDLLQVYETDLAGIAGTRRLVDRLADELEALRRGSSLTAWVGDVGRFFQRTWGFELTTVDQHSITVGKVVTGLVLLVLGVWLSRLLARLLFQSLLRRFGLDEGVAAAVRSLAFYAFVVTFTLFALRVVQVPLTVFTLLGGALAIGIGFGSQNIVNNFISGLVLLTERPVRVGDLIQVEDLHGTVIGIGARSTKVRTGNNVDIIVPNSSFLEKHVVNWTLGDDTVRVFVSVGVVYGSPVREVQKLLMRATEEHGRILKNPEPFVLFTDFGNDALMFEVHFWTRIRRVMDRLKIESDVRFRIEKLFQEAGIVIAFPQRDVHLDSAGPVEVRVVRGPPPAPSEWEHLP